MLTQYVGIRAFNGKYLTSTSGGKIFFDKNDMKDNEIFSLKQDGVNVTLKTKFGKYISVTSNNNGLEAEKDKVGNSEKFEIDIKDNNKFTLKTLSGLYVSAQKEGKIELVKKQPSDNETFQFVVKKVESLTDFLKLK